MSILDKYRQLSTEKYIPLQASLELTYRCNERCTHCYIEDFNDDKTRILELQDWQKILSELRQAGALYIILMGGEAMLNPHFFDILRSSSDLGFHTSMITNGIKIQKPEVAERLKASGIKRITCSVYSLEHEVHDKMTSVRGSLQKTLNAIRLCKEAGIEVSINSLLTKANAAKIFDIYDWTIKNNFDLNVDPNVTAKLNGNLEPTKYRADEETLIWYYRELARRWPNGRQKKSGEQMENYVCNAGKGKCAVNPYGELLPCIEIRDSLGSLVHSTFEEAWHSHAVKKWRHMKVKDLKGTGGLEFQNYCDHCPGMAHNETKKADTISCYTKTIASARIKSLKRPEL